MTTQEFINQVFNAAIQFSSPGQTQNTQNTQIIDTDTVNVQKPDVNQQIAMLSAEISMLKNQLANPQQTQQTPQTQQTQTVAADEFANLKQQINSMYGMMQMGNISSMQQPQTQNVNLDAVAEILNPSQAPNNTLGMLGGNINGK